MLSVYPRKKRNITEAVQRDNALFFKSDRGLIRVLPISERIVRISYTESDSFSGKAETRYSGPMGNNEYFFHEAASAYEITMPELKICVDRESGSISFFDKKGNLLLKEADKESKILDPFDSFKTINDENAVVKEIQTADGVKRRIMSAPMEFDRVLYHTKLSLELAEDEVIFGLGQNTDGVWNYRKTTQYLHQANLKSPIPMLLSSRGYGILMSTYSPMIFSDCDEETFISTYADEYLDYYFIVGGVKACNAAMRYLTGKASLLPKWAFGYIQSQERYESAKELLDTAKQFKELDFPVSALVQDWLSWPDNLWGQKSFDLKRYPDVKALTDELHAMDIHMMVSVWPNMARGGSNHEEFKSAGLFLPNSDLYNCLSEEGRALYWKQAKEGIFDYGTDGWWGDNCEPVCPEWEKLHKIDNASSYFDFINSAKRLLPEDELNVFCLYHGRSLGEGQRRDNTEKRVINLTRSGYPGSQKYGAVVWSGDTAASWNTLCNQVTAGLQFMTTGMPWWNLDIGAFFVKKGEQWYWNGDYDKANGDADYLELYTRWFQYATFLPMMRAHGTDLRREPWNISAPGTKTYEILKAFARLRNKLMPYIYSLAGSVYLKDESMVRPLLYDYPEDREAAVIGKEFMLGPNILVAPVVTSLSKSGGKQKVYLPKGIWYDFFTGEQYSGGRYIENTLSIDRIPVFVPAGAIIPVKEAEGLILRVYEGADGSFDIYNDLGDGYGYEKGEYHITTVQYSEKDHSVKLVKSGDDRFYEEIVRIEFVK